MKPTSGGLAQLPPQCRILAPRDAQSCRSMLSVVALMQAPIEKVTRSLQIIQSKRNVQSDLEKAGAQMVACFQCWTRIWLLTRGSPACGTHRYTSSCRGCSSLGQHTSIMHDVQQASSSGLSGLDAIPCMVIMVLCEKGPA